MKVDPKPYFRSCQFYWAPTRPFRRRWMIEFWADEGGHSFRVFWTKWGAVRWAARYPSVFEAVQP